MDEAVEKAAVEAVDDGHEFQNLTSCMQSVWSSQQNKLKKVQGVLGPVVWLSLKLSLGNVIINLIILILIIAGGGGVPYFPTPFNGQGKVLMEEGPVGKNTYIYIHLYLHCWVSLGRAQALVGNRLGGTLLNIFVFEN